MTRSTVGEIRLDGEWRPVDVDEVLAMAPRQQLRCIECRGAVRAHREGTTGQRAHFEHRVAHRGCSRGSTFSGTGSAHPAALS